ncbi:tRNA (guanosine(37)-N1)-methyltransferase TrmD [Amphibiibacter pelophylacis]|uniref:tRNA (Guanosine(37)-N1)-methyltransferase TrmD n=1 Tax=Amphibiibacter pelophylacis TaxID=1799477 RepID=A0ACC6NXZ2_9BURK
MNQQDSDGARVQRVDLITLFPELFPSLMAVGVTRRAYALHGASPDAAAALSAAAAWPAGGADAALQVHLWALRDFAQGTYRRVDDRPFGGGPGMVMMAEPLERALAALPPDGAQSPRCVIHFSPSGQPLTQLLVQRLERIPRLVVLCGRYEGIDQRVLDRHVDLEISLGDFVLSGGELPALALLDAMARLKPGVLNTAQSHEQDSFSDGLLEGPCYTRPERLPPELGGLAVPDVLLSGDHARIERWRREQSLAKTARIRPDLLADPKP